MIDLIINGYNAREIWGVITTPNTISALLAPAPMKEYATFTSRTENGSRIDMSYPRVGSRELNLELQMIAGTPRDFYARHGSFCRMLRRGKFNLSLSDRPDIVYHLVYNSCSQYTQFCRGMATLSLKCTEPNPRIRFACHS